MRVGEGKGGKEDAHSGVNEVSRDLRHKVMKRSHEICEEREEIEEIELSLGLSMNGRFGIDPTQKKLRRSSSVSNVVFAADNSVGNGSHPQARVGAFGSYAPLVRASSMPEWRRQGEFQAAENLENGKCPDGDGLHVDANGTHDLRSQLVKESNQNQTLQNSSSLPFLRKPIRERPNMDGSEKGKGSPRNTLTDMPYVSTRGVEPNHKKIEGFLYRYRRGEEVKIVCVCHGMFLSPAEFVKHGGGGDVAHPLKHIVVNPFPLY